MKFWHNLSISKKLYFVVGIMAFIILVELFTLRFAMNNLSAVRAFIGGESLWSKAQKSAVYQLNRYALTRNEKNFEAFIESLKIPEGDHVARMELSRPNPDIAKVTKGFLAGGVHPDDIPGMINLILDFYWFEHISKAIEYWIKADELIIQLKDVGHKFHDMILSGEEDPQKITAVLDHINDLNTQLDKVEYDFSFALEEGSRWVDRFVFYALFLLVMTVEGIGLTLTFFTSRSISRGLTDLNLLAQSIGQGDFGKTLQIKSSDEIGTLTHSVNKMSILLDKSYSEIQEAYKHLEEKVEERTLELARVAKDNARLYEESKHAVKLREEYLSVASHELRTPTTALLLNLQMLERNLDKDSTKLDYIKEQVHLAARISRRIAALNEVLLDLTRIKIGKLELQYVTCDLVCLVRDAVIDLQYEAEKKGASISFVDTDQIMLRIDQTRVGQVVTNLITNAIKYGGPKEIIVKVRGDSLTAFVEVKDFGPGIPVHLQHKIFDRYERGVDESSQSGLGLGLYISKQILDAHKGSLRVISAKDEGSTFTVELPLT